MEDKEYEYMKKITPNQEARDYFKNKDLTYADVTKERFNKLVEIVQKHLDKRNEEQNNISNQYKKDYTYKMDKCIYNKPTKKRPYMTAYIHVKVDNYSVREGISFNSDGWIGFAGWASTYNTIIFTEAFKEWVNWVVKDKCIDNRLFSDKFITESQAGGYPPGYEELTCSDLDKIKTILYSLYTNNVTQEDIVNVQDMCQILLNNICYLQDKLRRLEDGTK